jgi:hypothetical protein
VFILEVRTPRSPAHESGAAVSAVLLEAPHASMLAALIKLCPSQCHRLRRLAACQGEPSKASGECARLWLPRSAARLRCWLLIRCTVLQGGYDLLGLGDSVVDSFGAVLGLKTVDTWNPILLRDEPMVKVESVLREVANVHGL